MPSATWSGKPIRLRSSWDCRASEAAGNRERAPLVYVTLSLILFAAAPVVAALALLAAARFPIYFGLNK